MRISRSELRKLISEMVNPNYKQDFGHESPAANKAQVIINTRGLDHVVKLVPITASFNPFDDFDKTTIDTLKKVGFWRDPLYYIETNSLDEAEEVLNALDGYNTFHNSGGNDFLVRTVFLRD